MNKESKSKNARTEVSPTPGQPHSSHRVKRRGLLDAETALPAVKQAFVMLRPDIQWKNPVMFVVEVGAFLTLFYIVRWQHWEVGQPGTRSPISSPSTSGCS
jgi:potassium-transporting ATPase ATP-binding subunit